MYFPIIAVYVTWETLSEQQDRVISQMEMVDKPTTDTLGQHVLQLRVI